ncbi:MAG: hypothetical protein US31_C0003G0020 [Berkelbacteria bacterium GW2011_GWA1_36_9]|uniref:Phosphoribosyltransferase n=1 Tax=Berkelbacteria bacterium GW2011_GWA1_36_9 TaxID=1618331 RepID=A0A0G0IRH1_9BACT|nr:MAG: hypothetical protein US31_C0003G0020 [Berkelbacteria bacterium GW2011_GWA1_36_9]
MKTKAIKLINDLAKKAEDLKPPIHVIAVCSGGQIVGRQIYKYLKQEGIETSYYEAWTNIIGGRATVWKCDFKKSDYIGTVLLAEDVIWLGRSLNAVKKMLYGMKKKRVYVAVILDYNHKADFSNFN